MSCTYFNGVTFADDQADALKFTSKPEAEDAAERLGGTVQEVRVLDPRYRSMRSVVQASPGHVLIEADWEQAELWTLGALAGDDAFLHVLETSDLHSTMLVRMFGPLPMPGIPDKRIDEFTAEQLNKLRKKAEHSALDGLRTCAKTVNFG